MNIKINFKKILFSLLFLTLFVPLFSFAALSPEQLVYTPMEEIPGFDRPSTYAGYITAIYKFGLWTIGISAVIMISIGAFMYITSAGNSNSAGKAKGVIVDAISGVILAMISYVLLYTINPALLQINLPNMLTGGASGGSASVPLGTSGSGTTSKGYAHACTDSNSTAPIDFSQATNDSEIKLNSDCNQYDALFNKYGVDGVSPKLLKTIAQMESSCGKNKGPSPSGACGLMQILEKTAGANCDKLKSDDDFSVQKAAEFIRTNLNSSCVANAKDKNAAILAGYNSGYGCGTSACGSTKHALCPSSDCSGGALAYECCKNPGGLSESISYAWNGLGLLNK